MVGLVKNSGSIKPIDSCCDEISDMPAVARMNRVEWHF